MDSSQSGLLPKIACTHRRGLRTSVLTVHLDRLSGPSIFDGRAVDEQVLRKNLFQMVTTLILVFILICMRRGTRNRRTPEYA